MNTGAGIAIAAWLVSGAALVICAHPGGWLLVLIAAYATAKEL
jgi:hypothetical protein